MKDWVSHADFTFGDATQVPLHLAPAAQDEVCTADLSATEWVGPATLVALAAFLDRERQVAGRAVRVIAPVNPDTANYISRMGLARLFTDMCVPHDLPLVRADSALDARSLVGVSRFSSVSDVEEMIELLSYREVPGDLRDVICEVLSEMAINVPQHAEVEHGFMAAQVFDKRKTLRLSVADGGVGMLHTLRSQGALTPRQAMAMALSGVSESGREGGGRGIRSVAEAIGRNRGRAHFVSGDAMLTISASGASPWAHANHFQGTIFDAVLPLN